jgi:hypothetical protein
MQALVLSAAENELRLSEEDALIAAVGRAIFSHVRFHLAFLHWVYRADMPWRVNLMTIAFCARYRSDIHR